jgi:hypothetical protein
MKPKLPRAIASGKYFQRTRKDLHEPVQILSSDVDFPSGLSTGPRLTGHEELFRTIEAQLAEQLEKIKDVERRLGTFRLSHVPLLAPYGGAERGQASGHGLPGKGAQGDHPPMQKLACEMIHPGHPDDPNGEKPCTGNAVATTADGVNVCRACALGQLKEGFAVFWLHYLTPPKRECIFPFAHVGDRFRFHYPEEPEFDRVLTVAKINGFQPEDTVFFEDHTYCKQKHIKELERLT